jgi:hypothetical protein
MPKFVRIATIVCLSAAAVSVVLLGSFWLWTRYKSAQVENFYQAHRLLSEMRAVQRDSTNDSASARDALLLMVPVGTDKQSTMAALRLERLGCQPRGDSIECQATSPNVLGYKHWIINLKFDESGRLSDARVAIWNVFL